MKKLLIISGILISILYSKIIIAAEPLECLKDAKAPEVIKNERGFYILRGNRLTLILVIIQ